MQKVADSAEVAVSSLVSSGIADVDAGSLICAFLVGRRLLSCTRLANELGTRPLVVEECIRHGCSSRALRAQLCHYLQDHSAAAACVPAAMIQALQQAHARDTVPSSTRASAAKMDSTTQGEEEDILDMLDPSSRNHFLSLESAVGQSFSSIMSDPSGARARGASSSAAANADWGGWLGSKLSSAFDYNANNGPVNRAADALEALRVSYQTNEESSAALLTEHAPDGKFEDYVQLISSAYAANSKEDRSPTSSVFNSRKTNSEDLPWPTGVPAEVFNRGFEPSSELLRLPSAPASQAAGETAAKQKAVELDNFTRDTELLEARSVELRQWESDVERCLLEHVRSKSEDFFSASLQFTHLSGGAGEALACVRTARQNGVAPAQAVVRNYVQVGVLHRRRQNYQALSDLVGKVQEMRGRLERVENWVALQERDMTKLPEFVEHLLSLQAFIAKQTRIADQVEATTQDDSDGRAANNSAAAGEGHHHKEDSPSLGWIKRLKCLQDVPTRAAQVDKAMKVLIIQTIVGHLSANTSEEGAVKPLPTATLVQACQAAAELDVFEDILHQYQRQVVQNVWPLSQTTVINTLMTSDNAMTEEVADQLFTLVTTTTAATPLPAEKGRKTQSKGESAAPDPDKHRKAFLGLVAANVRFPVLITLLSQMQEALCGYMTHVAQQLASLLVECLPPGSSLARRYGNGTHLRDMCVAFFAAVRTESEFILSQLVTLREQHVMPVDAGEVETIVECSYRWGPLMAEPLREVEHVHGNALVGLSEAVLAAVKSPIRLSCQKLCRHFFRTWHTQQVEKLTMVLDNETWEARDDINALFQSHFSDLCRADDRAVRAFDTLSLEAPPMCDISMAATPVRHRRSTTVSLASTLTRHPPEGLDGIAANDDGDDLLRGGTVNRLFLSLDDDKDCGRVVCGAFLILVEQLYGYDAYTAHFPSVALETTTRMHELLALFDSKTASLVLGAKAVEKGTLRSISTQHLCVASQCVALLSEFIPLFQERLLRVLHVEDARDEEAKNAEATTVTEASKQAAKLRPFIEKDMSRIVKDARAHRNECYHKIVSLVKAKVDSLGRVEPNGQWPSSGNEWVMTMLRETARLLRALKPYLPPLDVQGVVAPLLGTVAGEIREVTRVIPSKATDARAAATSDVLLFRANVEKFGYDVLLCAGTTSPATAMRGPLTPQSTEEDILNWFFPAPRKPAAAQPA